MRAYSGDLRQRVLAAVERGMPRQQVVATFGVSLATIKRWLALRRGPGDLTPKRPTGRRRRITAEHHGALWAQVAAQPDATMETHAQVWNEAQAMTISPWTMGRAIRRLGWTRKKSRWGPANGTSGSARHTTSGSRDGRRRTSWSSTSAAAIST